MLDEPLFKGIGVALVTLFGDDGELDAKATADLAWQIVELGATSVLVAGSTGEAASLETAERVDLVAAVRAVLPPAVPVLAGSGAPTLRQAVVLTRAVLDVGADAVLALSPPRSSDPRPYYDALAQVSRPDRLLAYHFPAASAPGLSVQVLPDLPVAGLKDSSGDLPRLYEEVETFPGWLYTGSADLVLVAGALGCPGAILAVANISPELALKAFEGDGNAQLNLASKGASSSSRWPMSLKEAVAERFHTSTVCRMG